LIYAFNKKLPSLK